MSRAQPRGSTWPLASPNRRQSARQAISRLATTRIAASASAARCSALPWPYAWPGSAGRIATPSATKVRIAAIRSVPECAASESRPRLFVAIPARRLTAISTQAATIETSAVRRWGLTTRKDHTMREARFRGPLRERCEGTVLRVGDVALEPLRPERPGAVALVGPMPELQRLVLECAVFEVELAGLGVGVARECRARAEERRDPNIGEAAVGRAGRVRVERAARDPALQEAVEAALHAGEDGVAVAALRLAGPRALAGVGRERPAIAAQERVLVDLVLVHRERALRGVDGPRVLTRSVVVGDHVVRAELAVLAMTGAMTVAGVRKAGRREGECGHEQTRQNPSFLHLRLPPGFRR